MPLRAPDRPRRSGGDATRERLLQAGRRAFARDGYEGTRIQAILDETGVAPTALYHHFGSKLGLFLAVAQDVYSRFLSVLGAATEECDRFDDALDALLNAAGQLHRDDPTLAPMSMMVQFEARRDPALYEELAPMLDAFRDYVAGLARRAPARVGGGGDERSLTLALIAILNGLSGLAVALRDPGDFVAATTSLRTLISAHDAA